MTLTEYYQVLGLSADPTLDEIKKAYRQKARLYHPDLNHSPDAKEKFIIATEAYEFLVSNLKKVSENDESYRQAMEYWRRYRMTQSRRRANAYARASYIRFKKTKFYRTTRIFDATTIIVGLAFSILMIVLTIFGFIYRLHNPIKGFNPLLSMIMFMTVGLTFFILSFTFLKEYLRSAIKHRKKK